MKFFGYSLASIVCYGLMLLGAEIDVYPLGDLLQYGGTGGLIVFLSYATLTLWRELVELRKHHSTEIKILNETHSQQFAAMSERIIADQQARIDAMEQRLNKEMDTRMKKG